MINKIERKQLFFLFSIHSISLIFFYSFFFIKNGFLPFEYEIDTLIYSKITESLKNFSFPISETFGMSPIYPFLLLPFSFLTSSFSYIIIFNISVSYLLIYILFKFLRSFNSSGICFNILLLIIVNPYFLYLIYSGFSELIFYTILFISFFLLKKNRPLSGIFFNVLGINIRPEFIFLSIIPFFMKRKEIYKNILLYLFFSTLILFSINMISEQKNQPFYNKFRLFSTVFSEYSKIKDENTKNTYLQKIYFLTEEGYDRSAVENTISELSADIEPAEYLKRLPSNFLKNLYRVIKIFLNYFYFPMILFLLTKNIRINRLLFSAFISPFIIISLFPIETWEFRYFIYSIFIFSYYIGRNSSKKTVLTYSVFLIVYSFIFNISFCESYKELFEIRDFLYQNKIHEKSICSKNVWTGYLSGNTHISSPPYAEELQDYENYIKEKNIDYIIIDNELINSGESFYNSELIRFLDRNFKRMNSSIPYVFKVSENEE